MQTTSKPLKKGKQSPLLIDDTLKNRSVSSPLFDKKVEKAKQIMARVRAKQAEQ